jgi:hypothetical protein
VGASGRFGSSNGYFSELGFPGCQSYIFMGVPPLSSKYLRSSCSVIERDAFLYLITEKPTQKELNGQPLVKP